VDLFSIEGKNAVVTGARQGIGFSIAKCFAVSGANVLLADVDSEVLEAAKSLENQGLRAKGCVCDLGDEKQRASLMDQAAGHFDGRLDILVNNAGI